MGSDNEALNYIVAVSAVTISTIVMVFSIIFAVTGIYSRIPLDATIFTIFLVLLLISFGLGGFLIFQAVRNSYRYGWLSILVFVFGFFSLISLILSFLGLYDALDIIFAIFYILG